MNAFDREERSRIERALAARIAPACPRCAGPLSCQPLEPGPAVAYVRNRVLFVCPRCGGHASVDEPRVDAEG